MFAMAELGGEDVSTSLEADAPERGERRVAQPRFAPGVAPEPERVTRMRLHGEGDVVERGEIKKKGGDLKRAREAEQAAAMNRQRRDVAAGEADAPGIG